jgi:hypothetical protein
VIGIACDGNRKDVCLPVTGAADVVPTKSPSADTDHRPDKWNWCFAVQKLESLYVHERRDREPTQWNQHQDHKVAVAGVDVVVGTPGRLVDLFKGRRPAKASKAADPGRSG